MYTDCTSSLLPGTVLEVGITVVKSVVMVLTLWSLQSNGRMIRSQTMK